MLAVFSTFKSGTLSYDLKMYSLILSLIHNKFLLKFEIPQFYLCLNNNITNN